MPEVRRAVMRGIARRLVRDQQFNDHFPRFFGARGCGLDLHSFGRRSDAGGSKDTLALNFDHAGAAVAVGPVAGLARVTKVRDIGALPYGHVPDRLAGRGGRYNSVKGKGHGLRHRGPSVSRQICAGRLRAQIRCGPPTNQREDSNRKSPVAKCPRLLISESHQLPGNIRKGRTGRFSRPPAGRAASVRPAVHDRAARGGRQSIPDRFRVHLVIWYNQIIPAREDIDCRAGEAGEEPGHRRPHDANIIC